MRNRPVIPMIARLAMRPWRFGDYVVPARTPVGVSIIALHHRPDVYPDPHAFEPQRFLGVKPGTYTWIPFGGGIRRCLGATLAMAEQRVVLEAIARRTDLVGAGPHPRAPADAQRDDDPPRRLPGARLRTAIRTGTARSMVPVMSASDAEALAAEPAGHRERLIAAMATSIEEKGYRDTTVADVVRIARTSRRNFYEHFADRDACFLALFDATNEAMMREIADAVQPDRPLDEQVDRAVDAYIDNVAATPALYRSFVRELPGLGQAGADRGLATLERFAEMLVGFVESGRQAQPELELRPLTMDTAIIIVGGLRELLVIALQRGRDMRELRASAEETIKAILGGRCSRPGSRRYPARYRARFGRECAFAAPVVCSRTRAVQQRTEAHSTDAKSRRRDARERPP